MMDNASVYNAIKICITKIFLSMISVILYGLSFEYLIEIINRGSTYMPFIAFYVIFMFIFSINFILLLTDTICEIIHVLKLLIINKKER